MSQPHDETGEVDSSGNRVVEPPRREEPDGPPQDEDAKARPGHPATQENSRGG
ncbi:hypothetical protein [Amycolatopsis sp. CA-126428]|uniref:hypothetical protein n=1 Tax=Amycolatopsis sp. CA-126428 TaxID=2073158 RepID=UPI001304D2ED|nr:hypothetical protein [Amycolatopsis sp. CA-126428]